MYNILSIIYLGELLPFKVDLLKEAVVSQTGATFAKVEESNGEFELIFLLDNPWTTEEAEIACAQLEDFFEGDIQANYSQEKKYRLF